MHLNFEWKPAWLRVDLQADFYSCTVPTENTNARPKAIFYLKSICRNMCFVSICCMLKFISHIERNKFAICQQIAIKTNSKCRKIRGYEFYRVVARYIGASWLAVEFIALAFSSSTIVRIWLHLMLIVITINQWIVVAWHQTVLHGINTKTTKSSFKLTVLVRHISKHLEYWSQHSI